MILELNNFDTLVAFTVACSAILGMYKGLTKSVIWLLGIFSSVYFIINYRMTIASKLTPYVSHEWLRITIAVVLIIFVLMLTATLLSKILQTVFKAIGISSIDHLIGLIFGGARGAIIAALLLNLILLSTNLIKFMEVKQSRSWPILKNFIDQRLIKTSQGLSLQTANLSSLKTYLHKQLDHFEYLGSKHAPKHHK